MRGQAARIVDMPDDNNGLTIATERFERRLAEEIGKVRIEISALRVEISAVRIEMANGLAAQQAETAALRAEMIERNAELLKWILVFNATMIAAIAALLVLLR